ncbi:hypothetical protein ILYODFUR_023936 [Ilyodon furcidens]|uniref:Uncharacterized protein n=1 Tax=Ilyodon furcidens TaxID=33524 RepID=A0ABV0U9S9_9TELE
MESYICTNEEVIVEESAIPAQSPLVAVTFQRNANRKEKYLEAEPKALGITQICLSVYTIIGVGVFEAKNLTVPVTDIPLFISSLLRLLYNNRGSSVRGFFRSAVRRTAAGDPFPAHSHQHLQRLFEETWIK